MRVVGGLISHLEAVADMLIWAVKCGRDGIVGRLDGQSSIWSASHPPLINVL